jgi:SAM-dependent methyltransferase
VNWRIKGLVQKIVGQLPAGDHIHYLLQRRFGQLKNFEVELDSKVDDWRIMVGHLRGAGLSLAGSSLFEIGSGWYPTFPMACFLAGARRVVTVDLTRHMKPDLTLSAAVRLGRHLDTIAAASGAPAADVQGRHRALIEKLRSGGDVVAASAGVIDYRAPTDARDTQLPEASFDCVFSNSVLEHVPPDVIQGIFREARRILRPKGIMFHSVNCGDHYAYVDGSISQLNYLQFSDEAWRFWQNEFLYQNRLRAHEFIEMAESAGLAITLNTAHATERRLKDLEKVRVDPVFARFPREQLCITTIDFIAEKTDRPSPAS